MTYNEGEKYVEEVHRIIREWETHKIPQRYGQECVRLFGYYVKQSSDDMSNASWDIYSKFPDKREEREQYNIGMIQDYPFQLTWIHNEEEIKKFMYKVRHDKSSKPKGLTYDEKIDPLEDIELLGLIYVTTCISLLILTILVIGLLT